MAEGREGVGEGAEPSLELAQHLTLHLSTLLHPPCTIRTKSRADLIWAGGDYDGAWGGGGGGWAGGQQ